MRDRPARRLLLAALASALVAVAVTSAANGASGHSGRRAGPDRSSSASTLVCRRRRRPSGRRRREADQEGSPDSVRSSVAQGTTAQTIETLNRDPRVAYAEPNFILHAADVIPNDPFFPRLWGLHNTGQTVNWTAGTPDADIDAPEAWSVSTGSPDVVVAVIDTGVDTATPTSRRTSGSTPARTARLQDERRRRRRQRLRRRLARMGLRERRQQPRRTTTGTARMSLALLPHSATTVSASPV